MILVIAAAFSCLGVGAATAGAWPVPPGKTQVIVKYERQTASQGFNAQGQRVDINRRRDEAASMFVEHGLTERLTLQAKAGVTRGRDQWVDYAGRGPIELGLRWAVRQDDRSTLSLYLGAAEAGAGRNAGYAAPGEGSLDLEARVLYGRSAVWRGKPVYLDIQAARLRREGLADENRLDVTLGLRPTPKTLFLAQTYAGQAEREGPDSRWLKSEISVVRAFGAWSAQVGWRDTVAGRETARDRGVVLGVWRNL